MASGYLPCFSKAWPILNCASGAHLLKGARLTMPSNISCARAIDGANGTPKTLRFWPFEKELGDPELRLDHAVEIFAARILGEVDGVGVVGLVVFAGLLEQHRHLALGLGRERGLAVALHQRAVGAVSRAVVAGGFEILRLAHLLGGAAFDLRVFAFDAPAFVRTIDHRRVAGGRPRHRRGERERKKEGGF